MSARVDKLRGLLPQKGVDALLISMSENRRYMSGFTGSAGYLFITGERAILGTDFRYTEQATGQSPDFEVVRIGGNWSWLGDQINRADDCFQAIAGGSEYADRYAESDGDDH